MRNYEINISGDVENGLIGAYQYGLVLGDDLVGEEIPKLQSLSVSLATSQRRFPTIWPWFNFSFNNNQGKREITVEIYSSHIASSLGSAYLGIGCYEAAEIAGTYTVLYMARSSMPDKIVGWQALKDYIREEYGPGDYGPDDLILLALNQVLERKEFA